MPHPDWLQGAIDRNPRTAKGRPGVASKDLIVEAIRLHLTESPNIDEASLEAAVPRRTDAARHEAVAKEFPRMAARVTTAPSGSSR
jgi:hypothetical protein